jgi:Tfp pilus assembly PilM family ATPase
MARLLAIEWDAREARVAVARPRGREVLVEHAFAVDLAPRDPGQTFADQNVGQRIAAALAARSIGRCETLVAVGRASIELRQLSLPPVPPEELPDVVRFQALRQFTGIGDDWPLDFVPLESSDPESLSVLAAAISPELVEQISSTCQAGELSPRRLVLRPFAAASLLRRSDRSRLQPCQLMVDLLADEADLTILVDEQVALVRTVRMAVGDESEYALRPLLGEIRRTIAAAHNQLRDRRVESVVLCGSGDEQTALENLIQKELPQSVETFDPFSTVRLGGELKASKPGKAGRFAPLLGMLLDEAAGGEHAIDFLHPRRAVEPVSPQRRNILIGATAITAVAAIVLLSWSKLVSLDGEIERLSAETRSLDKTVSVAERYRGHVRAVEGFLESDISWLEELRNLSQEMPSAEEVILTQFIASTRSPAGGQMILDGYTRAPEQVSELRETLRDDDREVVSTGSQEDERRQEYRWRFKETVLIKPRPAVVVPADAEEPTDSSDATPQDEAKTATTTTDSDTRR